MTPRERLFWRIAFVVVGLIVFAIVCQGAREVLDVR